MSGRHGDSDGDGLANQADPDSPLYTGPADAHAHQLQAALRSSESSVEIARARTLTAAATSPAAWGLDAASKISLATMKAEGASFICVYLAPGGTSSWKVRSLADVHDYLAGGYSVVFNWEATGTPAGGWATGVSAAQQSQAQLNVYRGHCSACAAKISVATPIYFNFADLESPNTTDLGNATKGAASVVGLARTGGYGGYATIKWLFDQGLITWGWQTYAWSSGNRDPRAQLYQRLNTSTIDYDVAYAADYGQVPRPGGSTPAPTPAAYGELMQDKYPLVGSDVDVWDVACGSASFDGRRIFLGVTLFAGTVTGWVDFQDDDSGVGTRHPFSLTVPSSNLSPRWYLEVPSGTTKARVGWDATKAQKANLTLTGGK